MLAGDPRWSLYRGHIEKMNNVHTLGKNTDQEIGMEDSWEMLRKMIEINSGDGGDFTIYVMNNPSNRGWSTYYRKEGPATQSGIGNLPQQYTQMGFVPKDQVQEEIRKEKEKWDLERRLEDMEAMLDSIQSMGEQFLGSIMQTVDWNQILAPFAKAIAAAAGGKLNPEAMKNAQVSIQGQPEGGPAVDDGEPMRIEFDRINPALGALAAHYEDPEDFYRALDGLAVWASQNPETLKQFGHVNTQ